MYTDKQAAIIATLLDKWQHRNTAYNSIIVSSRQFEALRNVLTESNLCGHISYIGVSPDGRTYGICYNRSRGWYTMTVDKTAAVTLSTEKPPKNMLPDPMTVWTRSAMQYVTLITNTKHFPRFWKRTGNILMLQSVAIC